MNRIIDRRLSGKNKSAVNRQRFIKRFRGQIKKAVADAISNRSITDIDNGETINIPENDISEPVFHHGNGGKRDIVQPGNKEFISGDKFDRPAQGSGKPGGQASNSGEGYDDFVFQLSRDEFLQFFFDDLALPDLVKTKLASLDLFKYRRAGFTSSGVPCNINIVRSLKTSLARRIALRGPHIKKLREAESELEITPELNTKKRNNLIEEVTRLKKRVKSVPFIDEFDIRYNNRVRQPQPSTQAVMFCLMDVSGSMDQERKDIAKRFFTLLYLFLRQSYKKIDLVFIRHHTTAKEVSEEEFFYSRETGGTVVSSALELSYETIQQRYPSADWNIYAAQASDGDNWHGDSPLCKALLSNKLMPLLQYYAYVEIGGESHQSLWEEYTQIAALYNNFAMRQINSVQDIFPVFHDLFKKLPA